MKSTLSNYSNLTQRIVTGLAGTALMVTCILWSEWSYYGIFLFICVMSQLEFYKLTGIDGQIPLKSYGTFCGASLFTLTFLNAKGIIPTDSYFLIFPLFTIIYLVKLYKKKDKKPFTNIAFTFMGILYIALPFSLLNIIAFSSGSYDWRIVTGLLLLLWSSDTGAYFAGVNFGKRKLFERISPKKSWEGFLGGAVLSLSMALLISNYFENLSLGRWLSLSAIIIIAGTYGDLVESLFKRSISIKDSSTSIPGHGGFLDRFDGLLLAIPFIIAYIKLITYLS